MKDPIDYIIIGGLTVFCVPIIVLASPVLLPLYLIGKLMSKTKIGREFP